VIAIFGRPKDVEGECNARLSIGDDHGDNSATIRCQLPPGHDGPHKECYNAGYHGDVNNVTITWDKDTREQIGVAVGKGEEFPVFDND